MSTNFLRLEEMVTRISGVPGSLKKKEILAEYKDVTKFLHYTYNPFLVFHISSKNIKKNSKIQPAPVYESFDGSPPSTAQFFNLLDLLASGELSGHIAIATVKAFIAKYPQHEDIIYCILDKDLEMRLGDTEVNKVFPGLVPTFDVALAESWEPEKDVIEDGKWFISRKLDGCLHESTIVEFEDGSKETISNVVNNKINKRVKSFNHKNGKVEYKKIKNYMKDMTDINENNTNWYEIEMQDGRIVKLTGNHKVWIPAIECYRRVDDLDGNEEFLID